ncbi:TfoX/Sxy family DNA transformation protein [Vibrio sp. SCSIO 43135]|uniref:TfoX/Sxy family DNA transformation protein n=1 Tax=Vibrio paucivorans TaxID=2829489 RepID=A0A9X3CFS4_9VIBR|nr:MULTISPECIES: TfoX/Sxy family DNA transformation protein [Vibrio]MCW8334010.1 TfoX/Sxy family DNA transformation protein [Vibrio paucivorans]USD42184.1 TfoX/Sxy family DNA transformation protein [Vibrio sp. SCSIO 43135]
MDMTEQIFMDYVGKFGEFQKRSMFGGVGLFKSEAMFALISGEKIFIRGGDNLDTMLNDLGCEKYRHVKKQTTATVNYYDITEIFHQQGEALHEIVESSIKLSVDQRKFQKSTANRRLRDLPNMQLTLERMVKKAGIEDVESFMNLGPAEVYSKVRKAYGTDVDVKLLWKFAGAVEGIHWKLIQEPKKRQLLASCH